MKCPKCGYLGFEPSDRCRHCGYEFSLSAAPEPAVGGGRSAPVAPVSFTRDRVAPLADIAPLRLAADVAVPESAGTLDLPLAPSAGASLFAEPPPPARTPLAVRRTAERPRSRTTPHVVRRPRPVLLDDAPESAAPDAPLPDATVAPAPAARRLGAAAIDGALLGAIDMAILYLTAQMAGVAAVELTTLPLVPLATFLLGLNLAYLTVFTANGGQTLGKMALGLKVESLGGAVTFGPAVVRVAMAVAGGLILGLGFMPALWRTDGRAVHDHLAQTRVVRVGA